jgi:hypothetical protein
LLLGVQNENSFPCNLVDNLKPVKRKTGKTTDGSLFIRL